MSAQEDKTRSLRERIARLRERLDLIQPTKGNPADQLKGVLKGILDLLADEL